MLKHRKQSNIHIFNRIQSTRALKQLFYYIAEPLANVMNWHMYNTQTYIKTRHKLLWSIKSHFNYNEKVINKFTIKLQGLSTDNFLPWNSYVDNLTTK